MKRILLALAAVAITSGAASAQYSDELRARNRRASVERFAFEFGVGTYTPDAGRTAIFSGDRGPQLRMEFDVLPLRIPYVGMLGAGFSFSWVKLDGKLCATATCDENDSLDDSGRLRLFPLAPLAVLRVDVLARELGIPIVLTGKIGPDIIRYDVDGGSSTGSGTVAQVKQLTRLLKPHLLRREKADVETLQPMKERRPSTSRSAVACNL